MNWRQLSWLWFLLALLIFDQSLLAQRRDPLQYIEILESADRVRKLQVERVVEVLNLKPGEVVADLGAGSGLFTRPIAREVGPSGTVYAIDIDSVLLAHIEETARREGLNNIETVQANEYDPRIPEEVNLVLICDTLHHIDNRPAYLKALRRYLKPGGRIAIIDLEKNWPPGHDLNKFTVSELLTWMGDAGFRVDQRFDFLEDNFFITFRY